ncbi:hypothetical protein AAG570_007395 [Ranatra chinensis]|uniref:Uncharacterized protein n=1 Tax=Ranatra chinensis TaxID=642074 RepID=A0ABD0XXL7_9HEMI
MEERSAALERATERLKGPGPAHTRLEVEERELRGSPTSAKKSMTCQEAVSTLEQWRDLIAQPPSTRTVKMLKRNYPQPVIDTVLKMLEKERWSVLEGAMAVYDRYDWSMRKDILQALHSGMESYRLATEEMGVWRKLAKLVGELVDEVRAEFMDRLEVAAHNQDIIDAKRHKKVAVAGAMETAKDRLKNVRAKQMMLEDMVNSMWTETKAMESRGHGEEDRERTRHEKLSETLRNLQEAIAAQDDMLHLREAINSSQQNEGSFFEDAYM